MRTSTLLTALSAAGSGISLAAASPAAAAAEPAITPAPILPGVGALSHHDFPTKTTTNLKSPNHNNARDLSKTSSCVSAYRSIESSEPHPTGPLLAWLVSVSAANWVVDNLATPGWASAACAAFPRTTPSPPAALSSAFSSYTSAQSSWLTSAAPVVHSVAKDCGGDVSALLEWMVVTDRDGCTSALSAVETWGPWTNTAGGWWNWVYDPNWNGDGEGDWDGEGPRPTGTGAAAGGGSGSGAKGTIAGFEVGGSGNGGSGGAAQTNGGAAAAQTSSSTGGAMGPRETGCVVAAAAAAVAVAGVVGAL